MTGDEVFGHAELATDTTNLVLEEPLQRLAELQVHLLRQSADIVMALDDLTRDVERLDAVGVDGTLCQPTGIGNLLGLSIKHFDKVATDNLTLLLRIGDSGQIGEELLAGIDTNDIQTQTAVVVHHLGELVLTQHAMIDEDTGEAVANGAVQQYGSDRAVDTSGEAQDDTIVAQLCLQFGNGAIDKRGGTPLLLAAADVNDEILKELLALKGVEHLGVELDGPD